MFKNIDKGLFKLSISTGLVTGMVMLCTAAVVYIPVTERTNRVLQDSMALIFGLIYLSQYAPMIKKKSLVTGFSHFLQFLYWTILILLLWLAIIASVSGIALEGFDANDYIKNSAFTFTQGFSQVINWIIMSFRIVIIGFTPSALYRFVNKK